MLDACVNQESVQEGVEPDSAALGSGCWCAPAPASEGVVLAMGI